MSSICCFYTIYIYWLNCFDIPTKIFWYAMYMLSLYNTYTDNLFCQGHDSAPVLDIMLLKQQHLSVSGQAADPARQHPPVEYVYRSSHPLLQFLPQTWFSSTCFSSAPLKNFAWGQLESWNRKEFTGYTSPHLFPRSTSEGLTTSLA